MPRLTKRILTAVLGVAVSASLVLGVAAWFAGYWSGGAGAFQPGTNKGLPPMKMWMYTSVEEGAESPGKWEEVTNVTADPNGSDYYLIPSVNTVNSTYELSSLHFGKVDSLVTLKEDNKVYLRFYFGPDVLDMDNAHMMAISLAYNTVGYRYVQDYDIVTVDGKPQAVNKKDENDKVIGDVTSVFDSIYFYPSYNNRVNLELPGSFDVVTVNGTTTYDPRYVLEYYHDRPDAMQFLQLRYAISPNMLAPGETGFDELKFSEVTPIHCGCDDFTHSTATKTETVKDANGNEVTREVTACENCINGKKCGVALEADLPQALANANCTDKTQGFYVYVELAPLLDAFGKQENILDYFVPAYMFFDVKLDIEIG